MKGLITVGRWVAFLPVGILCFDALQALPRWVYDPGRSMLMLALLLGGFWMAAIFITPYLACCVIAPKGRVAAIILGVFFLFFQGATAIFCLSESKPWWHTAYQSFILAVGLGGLVFAYAVASCNPKLRLRDWLN